MIHVGTAGWGIPKAYRDKFPIGRSQLWSYSQVFNCVEINSTFYNLHRSSTFLKWRELTPDNFAFSLKLHRSFTHESKLRPSVGDLKDALRSMQELGSKWQVLLLQFPGSLDFHEKNVARFYELIRRTYDSAIVVEPRNLTWMSKSSKDLMREFRVSKVIADPERCPHDSKKILSSGGITYFRLHGSPEIYRSSYEKKRISEIYAQSKDFKHSWVVFDNTAFGKATENALSLQKTINVTKKR